MYIAEKDKVKAKAKAKEEEKEWRRKSGGGGGGQRTWMDEEKTQTLTEPHNLRQSHFLKIYKERKGLEQNKAAVRTCSPHDEG